MLLLFNKPFQVLSQFTSDGQKATLAEFIKIPNVYPAGRLDYDSEGLLLLTDNGALQHLIASPKFKMTKTYWVQVEGDITKEAIESLQRGVELKDGLTKPAECKIITTPDIWPRMPPIRERANIPTSWIELKIREGKNRQVRRMTAHVGFPTLRLIRAAIGPYSINGLAPGDYQNTEITAHLAEQVTYFEQRQSQRKQPDREDSRKTTTPHRRRSSRGSGQISYDQGASGRQRSTKPTSRTRGKR